MVTCGNCGKSGHNKRSCPELKVAKNKPGNSTPSQAVAAPEAPGSVDVEAPVVPDERGQEMDTQVTDVEVAVGLAEAAPMEDAAPAEEAALVEGVALVGEAAVVVEAAPVVEVVPVGEEINPLTEETEDLANVPEEGTVVPDGGAGIQADEVEAHAANGTMDPVPEPVKAPMGAGEIVEGGEQENGTVKEGDILQEDAAREDAVMEAPTEELEERPVPAPKTPADAVEEAGAEPVAENGTKAEAEAGATDGSAAGEASTGKAVPSLAAAIEAAKAGTGGKAEGGEKEKAAPAEKVAQLPPPEYETFEIPEHWYQKPCVRVTGLAGKVTEEELTAALSAHVAVKTVSFEDEGKTSANVWLDILTKSEEEEEAAVKKLQEGVGELVLQEQTLQLQGCRPDTLLFIGNTPQAMDDTALYEFFKEHGNILRAFILCNAEGKSKGYGFVEFSHRDEAQKAKAVGGKTPSDGGKHIRVEPGDAYQINEMFSLSLFVDHLPRDLPNLRDALWKTFEARGGPVRDVYVLTDHYTGNIKGYGFVHFRHSLHADQAWRQLDGYNLHGTSLRVGFANPTKAAAEKAKRRDAKMAGGPPLRSPVGGMERARFDDRRDSGRGPGPFRPAGRFDDRGPQRGAQFDRRPSDGPRPRTGFSSPPPGPFNRNTPPQQGSPFHRPGPRPFTSPPSQSLRGNFGSPPGPFRPPQQQGPSFQGGFGAFQQRMPGPMRGAAPGPVRFSGGAPARPGFGGQARPGFGAPQLAPLGQMGVGARSGGGPVAGAGGVGARPQGAQAGMMGRNPGGQGPAATPFQAPERPAAAREGELYPQQGGYGRPAFAGSSGVGGYQAPEQQYPPQQQQPGAFAGYPSQQGPATQGPIQGVQSVYGQQDAYAQGGYEQQAYAQQGYAPQAGAQGNAPPATAVATAGQQGYSQQGQQATQGQQYTQQYAQQGQYAGYGVDTSQQVAPAAAGVASAGAAAPAAQAAPASQAAQYDYYNQAAQGQAQDYSAYYAQQAAAQGGVATEQPATTAASTGAATGTAEEENAKAWAAYYAQQGYGAAPADGQQQQQYVQQVGTEGYPATTTGDAANSQAQGYSAESYQVQPATQAGATIGDKRPADAAPTYVQPGGMESYYQQGFTQNYGGNYDAAKRAKF